MVIYIGVNLEMDSLKEIALMPLRFMVVIIVEGGLKSYALLAFFCAYGKCLT